MWSAGGRVALGNRFDLWGSVQQDGIDPLYWNAPRQNWSLGVSRSFGGPVGRPGQIVAPAAVPRAAGVTFSVPVAEVAESPSVAGDFNG